MPIGLTHGTSPHMHPSARRPARGSAPRDRFPPCSVFASALLVGDLSRVLCTRPPSTSGPLNRSTQSLMHAPLNAPRRAVAARQPPTPTPYPIVRLSRAGVGAGAGKRKLRGWPWDGDGTKGTGTLTERKSEARRMKRKEHEKDEERQSGINGNVANRT